MHRDTSTDAKSSVLSPYCNKPEKVSFSLSAIYISALSQAGVSILFSLFLFFLLHAFSREGICHLCSGSSESCIPQTFFVRALVGSNSQLRTELPHWCISLFAGIGMDTCVIPLRHGGLSLVQTTDYIYPIVDDPYMMVSWLNGITKYIHYRFGSCFSLIWWHLGPFRVDVQC